MQSTPRTLNVDRHPPSSRNADAVICAGRQVVPNHGIYAEAEDLYGMEEPRQKTAWYRYGEHQAWRQASGNLLVQCPDMVI